LLRGDETAPRIMIVDVNVELDATPDDRFAKLRPLGKLLAPICDSMVLLMIECCDQDPTQFFVEEPRKLLCIA
jgi:hypothetical protein